MQQAPPAAHSVETRSLSARTRIMSALGVLISHLPPFAGNWLADRTGGLVYIFASKSRRSAISNMRHVLGPTASRRQLKETVRGVFRNVMRSYYDLCRAAYMNDRQIARLVDFDEIGWRRVEDIMRGKRGVILVSGHFGSFDMIPQLIIRRGWTITGLIARIRPAWLSDFVSDLRAKNGLDLLLVGEEGEDGNALNLGALKRSISVLRDGGLLAVLADRNLETQGMRIPFFGEETTVATGVAKLAIRTNAVIVTSFSHRLPNNRYDVVFEEPIEPLRKGTGEDQIKTILTTLFARIEQQIARYPQQWELLQPVWRETRET